MHPSRRDLLRTLPAAALAGAALRSPASAADPPFPGMIVRQEQPRNLETPLSALDGEVVPNEHFFVRNHFAEPGVEPKTHKLTVEGRVERPLELTLDDLKKTGAVSKSVVLECAGNGRVFLVQAFHGNEAMADSVNHLLVVGFYLINLGFISFALRYGTKPANLQETIEFLSMKLGVVLLVLGAMHFFNMFNFDKLRKKGTRTETVAVAATASPSVFHAPTNG